MRACASLVLVSCVETGEVEPTVESSWSGTVDLVDVMEIPANEVVTIEAGTRVRVEGGAWLRVHGALVVEGTREDPVNFEASRMWQGIELSGSLSGSYLRILKHGFIIARDGSLELADSELLVDPSEGQNSCIDALGGQLTLEHVRLEGCDMALHLNELPSATVTGSVLEANRAAIVLSRTSVEVEGSDLAADLHLQDMRGDNTALVGGNYWGGGAPTITTEDAAQFVGTDDWSPTPITGAGPR